MTVIAATAAAPSLSPSLGAGGQGVDQGFDALLAVVNRSDEPAAARTAPTPGASKPASKAADKSADKADLADKADTASARTGEADAAAAVASDSAEDAASDSEDAAAQADAAALAAATLVAAMIPQAEETFVAVSLPDVDAAAPAVAAPTPTLSDFVAPPVAAEAVATPVETALDAALLIAPGVADDTTPVQTLATAAGADVKVAATPTAPVTTATVEIPDAALLETPITAEDAGVDVAALAAQAAATPTAAAKPAPKTAPVLAAPSTAPVAAAPVIVVAEAEAPPVVAAPVVETAPATAETVHVVAQAAAEPAVKVATAAGVASDTGPAATTEAVEVAGLQAASLADQAGADQGQTDQQGQGEATAEALIVAATDGAADPEAPTISQTTSTPVAANAEAAAPLRAETRGSPETVAQLSAEILRKLDAQTTRFDVALTPEGLGKVDVRIEIGRHGALTASMAFDTAQAAAELRGKSQELRQALSQAGFTIADNALRFDVSSQGGQNGQNAFFNFNGGEDGRRGWSGKAFQSAQNDDAPILSASDLLPGLRMAPDSGLDIRI